MVNEINILRLWTASIWVRELRWKHLFMSVLHIPFKFSIIPKDAIGNMIEITFGSLSKKPFKFSMLSRVFFFFWLKFSYEQWGRWFEPKFFLMEESENTTALQGLWPMILIDGKNDNDNLFEKQSTGWEV